MWSETATREPEIISEWCRVSVGVFYGHRGDRRSFKSEHFLLLAPFERESRNLEKLPAGQLSGLGAVEDCRSDVGGKIGEALSPPNHRRDVVIGYGQPSEVIPNY